MVYDNLAPPPEFAKVASLPEARTVHWKVKFLWKKTLEEVYKADYPAAGYAAHMQEISRRMTRELHKAGARLVAGTDMNFVGVVPGLSLHRELADLQAAGLSPYEALAAATVNAAECLGRLAEFGTVEAGKRADLVLLEADPLSDLAAVRKSTGVMVRGRWLTRGALDAMVSRL